MKKKIILITVVICTLGFWTATYSYNKFLEQTSRLKNEYPLFDTGLKHYVLVKKKPSHWVSLEKVPLIARWAIIVSEDWAFYEHEGYDEKQIGMALKESLDEGKLVRGASTITQQVIKNSLLSNEKTITRKVKEILLARQLEKVLTKDEILEIYLNLIELGDNIYGIEQASQKYFQKSSSSLNGKEAAFLAMLLPSPVKYAQSFRKEGLTPFAEEQVDSILVKLRQAKIITESQRLDLQSTPLSFEVMNFIDEDLLNIENEYYDSSEKGALLEALDRQK